jgi:hypothetical protein
VPNPGLTDAQMNEALDAFQRANGNINAAARLLGMNRMTYSNRLSNARRLLTDRVSPEDFRTMPLWVYENVWSGVVIVASDAHVWPFRRSISARALLAVTRHLRADVKMIVANGDFIDGARNNRHDPDGWNKRPSVNDEIEGVTALYNDWAACVPTAIKRRTRGNHESNFDRKLVKHVKEYEGVPGFALADHFPEWEETFGIRVNWNNGGHKTAIKHRYASSGVHAGYNATLKAGVTTVSGHTHSLGAWPFGDYNGRRWGVQTGCLTDPEGPQFEYAEGNPGPHCEGFAVLTYVDGELLPPETCEVINGRAWFRGQVWAEREAVAA